jgi:hypothetical protein
MKKVERPYERKFEKTGNGRIAYERMKLWIAVLGGWLKKCKSVSRHVLSRFM